MIVMDFDMFAAQRGHDRQGYGDAGMHSPAGHVGKANWRAKCALVAERAAEWQKERNELRREYDDAVREGRIRPPDRRERLEIIAAGHPDRQDVRAARRILARYRDDYDFGSERTRTEHGTGQEGTRALS